MANLTKLLRAIEQLGVDPDEIRLPTSVFDRLLAQAEDIADSEED